MRLDKALTFISLIACFSWSCLSSALAQQLVPGKLAGSFGVNASGASTYKIPIQVPPGIAGLTPSFSLDYNSSAGNGLAGVGWSIGGIGSITRCPKNLIHDAQQSAVTFGFQDRYCLDGERLLVLTPSNAPGFTTGYGEPQSEYRTENDGFSKIVVSAGTYPGAEYGISYYTFSPEEFTVKTKSGLTMIYGGTVDSQIKVSNGRVASWALRSIRDAHGNEIVFNYESDLAVGFGDQRIKSASYAGNVIEFSYESRLDEEFRFLGLLKTTQVKRLSAITTKIGGLTAPIVQRTKLTYTESIATKRSLLQSVALCDLTAGASGCIAPTTFAWSDVSTTGQGFTWSGSEVGTDAWQLVDLFGDGKKLYYSRSGTTHYAKKLNVDGTWQQWKWVGGNSEMEGGSEFVDLFGEGRPVFYTHNKRGGHYATRLLPDQTVVNLTWNTGPTWRNAPSLSDWQFIDLFGDNRKVFFYLDTPSGLYRAFRFNPDQTFTVNEWSLPVIGGELAGSSLTDLFGEGVPVFYRFTTSGNHHASRLMRDGIQSYSWSGGFTMSVDQKWVMADLFGEGKKLLYFRTAGPGGGGISGPVNSHKATRLSPELGTAETWQWSHLGPLAGGERTVDLLGGGRDMYYTHDNNGNHYGVRFSPDAPPEGFGWTGHGLGSDGWTLVDVLGDGKKAYYTTSGINHYVTRFLRANQATSSSFSAPSAGPGMIFDDLFGEGSPVSFAQTSSGFQSAHMYKAGYTDLLTGIRAGGSSLQNIEYGRLTEDSVYTKDTNSAYPQFDVRTPIVVVSQTAVGNGIGGGYSSIGYFQNQNVVKYKYGGLKAESSNGRGPLGFRWISKLDLATGIQNRTEYLQQWPYIGRPSSIETRYVQGTTSRQLSIASQNYLSINTWYPSTPCKLTQPCFAFVKTTNENSFDFKNASPLPAKSTNTNYDSFGNVKDVTTSTSYGGQSSTKVTVNEYFPPDLASWQLSRLKKASVTSTAPTTGLAAGIPSVPPLLPPGPPANGNGTYLQWLPAVLNLLLN